MRRIVTIKRAGGYDPKLGPKHPDNQDPTLVESHLAKDNNLTRTVSMTGVGNMGLVRITEFDDDVNVIECVGGDVTLDAERLWKLAAGILSLFGGHALTRDEYERGNAGLREKIHDVLFDNEARCLDDAIDRNAVLDALMKALR